MGSKRGSGLFLCPAGSRSGGAGVGFRIFRASGFRVWGLGFWGLGFWVLGFGVLGFRVLGSWVLGF